MMSVSDTQVDKATVAGNEADMREKMRQYLANTRYRKTEEDWFAPQVFTGAGDYLEHIKVAQPFFLLVDSFDPHEPWDPPRYYTDLYDPGYTGVEQINPQYGPSDYLDPTELRHMRAL